MNLSVIITNYKVFNEAQLLYGNFLSSLQVLNQPLQYLYENNEMDEEEEEEEEEDEEVGEDEDEDEEVGEEDEEVVEVTEQRNDFSTSATIQNSAFDQAMDLYIPNNYCPSFIVK